MPQTVEFEGQEYEFPDDATQDEMLGMLGTVPEVKVPNKPLTATVGDVSQLHMEHKAIRMDEGAVRNKQGLHMAYKDSKGFPTGGIGHLLTDTEKERYPDGKEIPDKVVNDWFTEDMDEAVGGVDRLLESHKVDVPEAVYDVLVNMSFNLGQEGLSEFDDMWAAIEIGDYEVAAQEMEDSQWFKDVGNRAVRLINRMRSVPSAAPKEQEPADES